jgi:hypothetical protein
MTLGLSVALLSGCATITGGSYCDLAKPHMFKSEGTVDMLMQHDRQLLTDTIVHNETHARICG